MLTINSELLQTWIIHMLWPLTRILGMIAVAPILSHPSIPNRVKLGLGFVLTIVIVPTIPVIPAFEVFSLKGLMILVQQLLIGLAIGFTMRLAFSAIELCGHLIGMTMGLGFATFFDAQSEGQSTALSQFIVMLAFLMFLSLDGHLILITTVAQSFTSMPISIDSQTIDFRVIADWGGVIFSTGLLLAMPVIAALLITNMALGILTRSAPQLNLFGIGFPITISMGFIVLALMLPNMIKPIERLFDDAYATMAKVSQVAK